MALEVEDGTGKSNAESYISVSDCETYLTNRGMTNFTGLATTPLKEAALRRAMRWIEFNFRTQWRGRRAHEGQALAWPRYGVNDQDGWRISHEEIPQALKDATCEAAEREADEAGSLSPDLERGGATKEESSQVGPIKETKVYFDRASNTKRFPIVEAMLEPFVQDMGGSVATYRT